MSVIKPYERNEELDRDFIQGWYMPDDLISELLSESKQLYADGHSVYKNNISNYHLLSFDFFSAHIKEKFLYHLSDIVKEYEKKYEYLSGLNYKLIKHINVQYWEPGKYYGNFHFEQDNRIDLVLRNLVFMTYLNDVKTGGETEFYYQKTKIQPKKGLTIVWPANWTHTHKGCKTIEHKHAVTGWFELITTKPDIYYDVPNKEICKREYE